MSFQILLTQIYLCLIFYNQLELLVTQKASLIMYPLIQLSFQTTFTTDFTLLGSSFTRVWPKNDPPLKKENKLHKPTPTIRLTPTIRHAGANFRIHRSKNQIFIKKISQNLFRQTFYLTLLIKIGLMFSIQINKR